MTDHSDIIATAERVKALAEKATPGPWVAKEPKKPVGRAKEGDRLIVGERTKEHIAEVFQYRNDDHKDETTGIANARFIADSRTSCPLLADAVIAMAAEIERYKQRERERWENLKAVFGPPPLVFPPKPKTPPHESLVPKEEK